MSFGLGRSEAVMGTFSLHAAAVEEEDWAA